jgi:hypothetical protein
MPGAGAPGSPGGPSSALPAQFVFRAAAVITGLVLLLLVNVHGVVFYVAWALIVMALATEALAMLVYWRRPH